MIYVRSFKEWRWVNLVQFWIGLIDNLIGIITLGFVLTSFELRWACWKAKRDCQKHLRDNK